MLKCLKYFVIISKKIIEQVRLQKVFHLIVCCCLVHFHLKVLSFGHTVIPRIGSYSFLEVRVQQVFKGGNYSFLNLEIVANSNSCHNISIFYLIN